eukprot:TRINITY_DN455_c3_g1_i1.p1 TRINITY_DN455_c3_g1~~TRINITY_DN455_c3_g1_i1.p1  ORF type:complete len:314 (-),score=32.45 TRINITY_DN455_c3_g1_i1:657-1598(-)
MHELVERFLTYVNKHKRGYCELPRAEYDAVLKAAGLGHVGNRTWGNLLAQAGNPVLCRKKDREAVYCIKCAHTRAPSTGSSSSPSSSPCTPPATPPSSAKRDRGGLPSGLTPGDRKKKKMSLMNLFDTDTDSDADADADADAGCVIEVIREISDDESPVGRPKDDITALRRKLNTERRQRSRLQNANKDLLARIKALEVELADARKMIPSLDFVAGQARKKDAEQEEQSGEPMGREDEDPCVRHGELWRGPRRHPSGANAAGAPVWRRPGLRRTLCKCGEGVAAGVWASDLYARLPSPGRAPRGEIREVGDRG